MTTDINLLRQRLETEQNRLMQELEQLKTNVCPAGEMPGGSPWVKEDECATEISEVKRRAALEKRTRDVLAEVEHALHKFDQGTYGLCDFCGQSIDPVRLEVLPRANLCLSCKTHLEKKKAKFPQARQRERVAYSDEKVTLPWTIADVIEDMDMGDELGLGNAPSQPL